VAPCGQGLGLGKRDHATRSPTLSLSLAVRLESAVEEWHPEGSRRAGPRPNNSGGHGQWAAAPEPSTIMVRSGRVSPGPLHGAATAPVPSSQPTRAPSSASSVLVSSSVVSHADPPGPLQLHASIPVVAAPVLGMLRSLSL
jgi:hypothetical protein